MKYIRILIYLFDFFLILKTGGIVSADEGLPWVQWRRNFGGIYEDFARSGKQTSDGGFIITGSSELFDDIRATDLIILKTDEEGNQLWKRIFQGPLVDIGSSMEQTRDGGFIITGGTGGEDLCALLGCYPVGPQRRYYPDLYLLRTDESGNPLWERSFGGNYAEFGISVLETRYGGFLVCGHTSSNGDGLEDIYVLMTDSDGNLQWERTFGGAQRDLGIAVREAKDEGYLILGLSWPSKLEHKLLNHLIKLDDSGNVIKHETFGENSWFAFDFRTTMDGGYIFCGGKGGFSYYLVKTDEDLNLQWEKTATEEDDRICNSVQELTDGSFIAAGARRSGVNNFSSYLVKTDSEGNLVWETTLPESYPMEISPIRDGGYIVVGTYYPKVNDYGTNIFLTKLLPDNAKLFIRGDSNGDGVRDISDSISLLENLFLGSSKIDCHDAADANDDGELDVSDAVFLLGFLFLGESKPPVPFGFCGADPTDDTLECDSQPACRGKG